MRGVSSGSAARSDPTAGPRSPARSGRRPNPDRPAPARPDRAAAAARSSGPAGQKPDPWSEPDPAKAAWSGRTAHPADPAPAGRIPAEPGAEPAGQAGPATEPGTEHPAAERGRAEPAAGTEPEPRSEERRVGKEGETEGDTTE